MYSAYTGVVHTKSDYINPTVPILRMKETSENKINFLKAQEQKIYKRFGAESYRDFIKILRELFNNEDKEVLQRFEANNLEKELKKFSHVNSEIFGEEVQFEFHINQLKNSNVKLKLKESEIGLPQLSYNSKEVKEELNRIFKGHNFNPKVGWTKNLDNFLSLLLKSGALSIKTKENVQDTNFNHIVTFSKIPNFPWGVMKQDIENAYALQDTFFLEELQKALVRIKKFIFLELGAGASKELKLAMTRLWTRTFSQKENNPLLFFHGSTKTNFISGVQGALGEFQAGLLFEYLDIKFKGNAKLTLGYNSPAASIIGSDYKGKEKLRTDVEIFKEIGLQVKNLVTIKGTEGFENLLPDRKISTTIHPSKFGQYLINPEPFYDIIANYYFNKTFQSDNKNIYNELIDQLKECLGEIMNMSVVDYVEDTISFYVIGGKFLLPASVILEKADELELKNSVKITSGFSAKTDTEYAGQSQKKDKTSPDFTDYWKHYRNGWRPIGKNSGVYNNLISHMISIRTSFRLFKDIDDYKIF